MSAVDDFLDTPLDTNGWGHTPPRKRGRVVTLGHYRRPRAVEDVPECDHEPRNLP